MKKEDQVGCGYCKHENICNKIDSKINKAKEGCEDWLHFQDPPPKRNLTQEEEFERQHLVYVKNDHSRPMFQEQQDRLQFLEEKKFKGLNLHKK